MFDIPNPVKMAANLVEAGGKFTADAVGKAGDALNTAAQLAQQGIIVVGGKVSSAIANPASVFDGKLDFINLANFGNLTNIRDGTSNTIGFGETGDYAGFYNEIGSLSGNIKSMQDQLTSGVDAKGNPLTPDQKLALQFEIQQAMQERLQLITLLSNLIKMEHDSKMAVINNTRG